LDRVIIQPFCLKATNQVLHWKNVEESELMTYWLRFNALTTKLL